MSAYKTILIDPRPASKDAMIELLKNNAPVWGIEFTLPALASYIENNIDGQHVSGATNKAACEIALTCDLPSSDTTLAVVRADTDALLAIAVLNNRLQFDYITDEMKERVASIARFDSFANGEWPGPRSLDMDDEEVRFQGLGAIAFDFKLSVQYRISRMSEWLKLGDCLGLKEAQQDAVEAFKKSVEQSKVSLLSDKLALVESTHIKATSVGYAYAPVLVIRNDAFRFAGGDSHVKYTVCAWSAGLLNFKALAVSLSEAEECGGTWGGSATIIGSPQGVSSSLTIDQIVSLVKSNML